MTELDAEEIVVPIYCAHSWEVDTGNRVRCGRCHALADSGRMFDRDVMAMKIRYYGIVEDRHSTDHPISEIKQFGPYRPYVERSGLLNPPMPHTDGGDL